MKTIINQFNKLGFTLTVDSENLTATLTKISTRARLGYVRQWAYRFKDLARLEDYCETDLNNRISIIASKEKRKIDTKRKNEEELKNIKVGDVFCYSWGYEQTNVDFYQIIKRPSKSVAIVRAIGSETIKETSWCSSEVKPVKDSFLKGGEFRVILKGDRFKRSCGSACKTNWEDKHYCSWGY